MSGYELFCEWLSAPHFQFLNTCSRWIVGRGDIPFWTENWLGEILNPLNHSGVTVKEALNQMDVIQHMLSEQQLMKMNLVMLEEGEEEVLAF